MGNHSTEQHSTARVNNTAFGGLGQFELKSGREGRKRLGAGRAFIAPTQDFGWRGFVGGGEFNEGLRASDGW